MVIEVVYKGYGLTCCTTYVLHIKSWIVSVEQALYFYLQLQNGRSQCAWLVCLFCECSNMDLCYSGKSCFTTVPGQTTGSWICQCPYQQHWVGSVQAIPSNHLLANGKQTKQHFTICVMWVLLPIHWQKHWQLLSNSFWHSLLFGPFRVVLAELVDFIAFNLVKQQSTRRLTTINNPWSSRILYKFN